MVVLPIIATLISLACATVIARDAVRRPRPDKVAWVIAFLVFAVGTGADAVGELAGWTPTVVRVYYLTGAVLVTTFLGLGELYLLAGRRMPTVTPGLTLLLVAVAAASVWAAPIDRARLESEHWEAIDRGPGLIALVAVSNAFGVVVLAGGALWSAWRFWRSGTHRHRMVGCLLIAAGTVVIASKGYLGRLGVSIGDDYFNLVLALGVALIFAGYLQTRRPDTSAVPASRPAAEPSIAGVKAPAPAVQAVVAVDPGVSATEAGAAAPEVPGVLRPLAYGVVAEGQAGASRHLDANGHVDADRTAHVNGAAHANGRVPVGPSPAPAALGGPALDRGAAFLEERFLGLDDAALAAAAHAWSAPRPAIDALSRADARRVWALRQRLSPTGQAALDRHGAPALAQLADLYFGVLAPEAPPASIGQPDDRTTADPGAPNGRPADADGRSLAGRREATTAP